MPALVMPALGLLVLTGCGGSTDDLESRAGPAPARVVAAELPAHLPACRDAPPESRLLVDTLATELNVPWETAVASDGTIFLTERTGRVLALAPGEDRVTTWASVPVFTGGEAGLLGLAVDESQARRTVLVVGTFSRFNLFQKALRRLPFVGSDTHTLEVRVYRYVEGEDGTGGYDGMLLGGVPADVLHAGAALAYGPDGGLYLTTGEALVPLAAQVDDDLRGKVLELVEGAGATDEAAVATRMVAKGLRNAQGLAWHPGDGAMWLVDHGPSGLEHEGGRTDHDELNRIEPGANLGWPWAAGAESYEGAVPPVHDWTPAVAPSDLAFAGEGTEGHVLWVSFLRRQALSRVVVTDTSAVCEDHYFQGTFGRLRSVTPYGNGVLVTTSNRDGHLPSRPGDDLLLWVRPDSGSAQP